MLAYLLLKPSMAVTSLAVLLVVLESPPPDTEAVLVTLAGALLPHSLSG